MHLFLHKCLVLVRSTGIEAVSTSLKTFIYKGFSRLLAKNTPIILGFRDKEILRLIFIRFLCFLRSTGQVFFVYVNFVIHLSKVAKSTPKRESKIRRSFI